MDHFGIGAAIHGAAMIYTSSSRRTGRTTSLVESVKDGDRIIFNNHKEAERVRRLCLERGVEVECIVLDPKHPERVFEQGDHGAMGGHTTASSLPRQYLAGSCGTPSGRSLKS